jgi:hypothetical protein
MSLGRLAILLTLAVSVAACSGTGGLIGGIGGILPCNTGTQVQLASPLAGQSGVSNLSQITLVANGNSNNLYSTYQNWYVYVSNGFGTQIQGGQLNLVADPNGPHPYASDFYYSSQLQQTLAQGQTWNAFLAEQNAGSCSAVPLGSFST